MATTRTYGFDGLTAEQVRQARERFGSNVITIRKRPILHFIKSSAKEPMVVLLLIAALLYFFSGQVGDGIFMACAVILVISISLYQESRSRNAIAALRSLTHPGCKVIRDRKVMEVNAEDLVVGDLMVVEEGMIVPADGTILQSNDFSVNESTITGESLPVSKSREMVGNAESTMQVYHGTSVVAGLAICRVTSVGDQTVLGKIGTTVDSIQDEKTPLQLQING
ncbi:MAG: HAD-IC family P-type ATPase, partial [Bacteroidota bacterium]|nr:HAD-IC family P-type ATPase [Bacteroidota bacterium]